jgi:tRNA threonylcarbamoyladenosine biosynthesis protein TsaB
MTPEPLFLLLETSGRSGWVALARGETLLGVQRLDEARRHARDLAPAVAELLRGAGAKPRDVQAVFVGRGPGSYTGLRVGIISAKAFAYATGCAVLALDTFAVIAAQSPAEALSVEILADAQQERIYLQEYSRSPEGLMQPATPLRIEPFAGWLSRREQTAWLSGPGLRTFGQRLPADVRLVEAGRWEPLPESLLALGLRRWQAGEREDAWALEPLYLRPSSAEEQWRGR